MAPWHFCKNEFSSFLDSAIITFMAAVPSRRACFDSEIELWLGGILHLGEAYSVTVLDVTGLVESATTLCEENPCLYPFYASLCECLHCKELRQCDLAESICQFKSVQPFLPMVDCHISSLSPEMA